MKNNFFIKLDQISGSDIWKDYEGVWMDLKDGQIYF